MNLILQKEIVKHIFNIIGIFRSEHYNGSSFIEPLTLDKFIIDKKLIFETDENKKYENNLWAVTTKIENSLIKMIVADTSEDIKEYTLILQMDNFNPCALRLSSNPTDSGSMLFYLVDRWVDVGTSAQAKILVGVESLSEIFIEWRRLDDYAEMYKKLIDFLNFYESVDHAW